jgi:NADPH:quinone reductase-like Zn-dependent oxidoreductase
MARLDERRYRCTRNNLPAPEDPVKAFALTNPNEPAALTDLPEPEIGAGGVLIRVHAASVNGFDVYQASGGLLAIMPHDLPTVIGRDLAGVVLAVGRERTDVAVGDEVLGFVTSAPPLHNGTWAELVAGGADLILARKPATLSWEAAAAIPLAASTALDAVDAVDPRPGDTVLIMGSTGGVGAFAIQFAAQRGARVLASAKPGEDDAFVRSLGASETIDYTQSGLGDTVRRLAPGGLAGLIDVVSRGEAFMALARLLDDGSRAATTLGAADVAVLAERGIRATNIAGTPTAQKLASLAAQVPAATLQVSIQQVFAFADAPSAMAAFSAGTRGKLVLAIG